MKKNHIIIGLGLVGCVSLSSLFFIGESKNLSDEALLSIIKNDQKSFEAFIKAGGDVHMMLPTFDGKNYTVAEGMIDFERVSFVKYLQAEKKSFIKTDLKKDYDVLTLTVARNNPEMLKLLMTEKPDLKRLYGKSGWSLLHMASYECSDKMVSILHQAGMNWNMKAADGSTPLTLAADRDCLPVLSYWKEKGADFKEKDGRGQTALGILKTKKDSALAAFAQSFMEKKSGNATTVTIVKQASAPEVTFYTKRSFPKDVPVDQNHFVEPEDRPEEANETADYSEFSD